MSNKPTLITSDVARDNNNKIIDLYECTCYKKFKARRSDINRGHTKSCGCRIHTVEYRDAMSKRNTIHGMSRTPTWNSWDAMKSRCLNPKDKDYKTRYGSKGITVSNEWLQFQNFLNDMGSRPEGMTLDRIDGTKGYYNGNCKWATALEQANNRKDTNMLSFLGETKAVADWARFLGVKPDTLANRIRHGWTTEEVLTIPINGRRYKC